MRRLVPRAKVAIGHGQMAEGMLERVMLDYDAGKFDVLVCTTIIESGLDIPNANTIIIARADALGLAQLYQLRGRVGRSDRRAYAYLLHRRGQPLSAVARKRLHAIFSASDLGAGYQIALSDLEIRGAGNILGAEQHGFMAAVGFELYTPHAGRGGGRGAWAGDRAGARRRAPGLARVRVPARRLRRRCRAKLEAYRRFAAIHAEADVSPASRAARPIQAGTRASRRAVPGGRGADGGRASRRARRARGGGPRHPEVAALRPLRGRAGLDVGRLPADQRRTRCGSRSRPVGTRSRQRLGAAALVRRRLRGDLAVALSSVQVS